MTAARIVGPVPAFKDPEQHLVGAEAWEPLTCPAEVRVPEPGRSPEVARWLGSTAARDTLEGFGPARLGFGARVTEMPLENGSFWEWAEDVPASWSVRSLFSLNRWAFSLVCSSGLDMRARRIWGFRDAAGRWWALFERGEQQYSPPLETSQCPSVWLLLGAEEGGPGGRFPLEFIEDFGGWGGSFHIALSVLEEALSRGRAVTLRREIIDQLQPLAARAEWEEMASAAAALAGPAGGWAKVLQLTNGGSLLRSAFDEGLRYGQTLGLLMAAHAVKASERARAAAEGPKRSQREARDAALREIVDAELLDGAFQPHTLAGTLLAEVAAGESNRGRILKALGLTLTQKKLGEKLSQFKRLAEGSQS